jgi:3-hydroxy-9,10-secoandrosta-1,3,5(10)-triene-9,17-dione monooxygenase
MTPEAYLERARALLPSIRERAAHTEQLRRLPDETFKDFQEAGLFRALQPKRYAGYELDPGTFYQAVIEVGTVCGSSAWILGVVGVHNWQLALFPQQAQDDVWGEDTSTQLSTSLAPTGTVERVDGGYRLSGRWSFSSGCDFCQWAILGGLVAPPYEKAAPERLAFLVPRRDYSIDDNWHVIGLCGTGSKDIVVEAAFVPEYRTFSYREAFEIRSPGLAIHEAPLYRLPFGCIFPYGIASPAIGVALGALHHFRDEAKTRVWTRDGARVAEDGFVQFRLAEAAAEVNAGRDRLLRCFADMMQLARSGQEIPLEHRARYRWEAAHAVAWSVHAVDRLFEASGGRAIFLNNPIQRAWRDVHAMRAHAGNNPEKAAAIFGRSEFGLPPQDLAF